MLIAAVLIEVLVTSVLAQAETKPAIAVIAIRRLCFITPSRSVNSITATCARGRPHDCGFAHYALAKVE